MKPKTSPTSPKAKKDKQQEKDLDNYYKDSLSNIVKPNKRKTPIWFLFIVIIFGFLGGILGQLVLLSYGSEIPFFDKLDIFSLTENQPYFISLNNKDNNLTIDKINKVAEKDKYSIVQIFEKNESSDGLDSLYLPENQLGLGLALTNDGYIITTDNVINDLNAEYVIITESKEIYLVSKIIEDPATDFLILTSDAIDLKTVDFAKMDDIQNSQEVLILDKYNIGSELQSHLINVLDKDYQLITESGDYVNSSEVLTENMLINSNIKYINNSLAFTFDNQVIGFVEINEGLATIYPFWLIENKINSILENNDVIRPYLGIKYVNLSEVINLSDELTLSQKKGALIFSDDEDNKPSIIEGSPAEKAGLETNDIIISINNQIINGHLSLNQIIQSYNAGDLITLKILRQEQELEIKITLESIN